MVSQGLDTGLFITIAFWGTVPTEILLNMLLTQYFIKLAIAVCDTPFCYLLVALLKDKVKLPLSIGAEVLVKD
jgi:uncharacterized PurR-regulated membrane protein YhhQ (DUF165 family)